MLRPEYPLPVEQHAGQELVGLRDRAPVEHDQAEPVPAGQRRGMRVAEHTAPVRDEGRAQPLRLVGTAAVVEELHEALSHRERPRMGPAAQGRVVAEQRAKLRLHAVKLAELVPSLGKVMPGDKRRRVTRPQTLRAAGQHFLVDDAGLGVPALREQVVGDRVAAGERVLMGLPEDGGPGAVGGREDTAGLGQLAPVK
jgi:hypothetical protein